MDHNTLRLPRRSILGGAAAFSVISVAASRMGAAKAAAPESINIAVASSNLAVTLQEILKEQEFFKKFGLTANIIAVVDGNKLMGAVISGDVDFCPLSGYAPIFPAIAKGAELKLINASVQLGQQALFSGKPEIKTIKDLAGKKIGVGSLDAQLYEVTLALLLKNGVDPKSVTFANIGSSASVIQAVAAGIIGAGARASR